MYVHIFFLPLLRQIRPTGWNIERVRQQPVVQVVEFSSKLGNQSYLPPLPPSFPPLALFETLGTHQGQIVSSVKEICDSYTISATSLSLYFSVSLPQKKELSHTLSHQFKGSIE